MVIKEEINGIKEERMVQKAIELSLNDPEPSNTSLLEKKRNSKRVSYQMTLEQQRDGKNVSEFFEVKNGSQNVSKFLINTKTSGLGGYLPHEQLAIQKLMGLGFDQMTACHAYEACGKDESEAATFLFDSKEEDDEDLV